MLRESDLLLGAHFLEFFKKLYKHAPYTPLQMSCQQKARKKLEGMMKTALTRSILHPGVQCRVSRDFVRSFDNVEWSRNDTHRLLST